MEEGERRERKVARGVGGCLSKKCSDAIASVGGEEGGAWGVSGLQRAIGALETLFKCR